MEGASGVHKGACFYCKEMATGVASALKNWNHDKVRRGGSYGQAGMNSARTGTLSGDFARRPGRAQEQSGRSGTQVMTSRLNEISPGKGVNEAYLDVLLNSRYLCALLDTGCEHTVIGRRLFPNAVLQPSKQKLYNASGTEMKLLGEN